MVGRPPKPTKLKILTGNPGGRPLNDQEPQPLRVMPDCPKRLRAREKKIWQHIAAKLFDCRLLTQIDDIALATFCEYYAEYCLLSNRVKREGQMVKVKWGTETILAKDPRTGKDVQMEVPHYEEQRSQVANARDNAWNQAQKILSSFGMDPAARSRLKVELGEKATDSYEEFRKRGKAKA